MNEDTNTESSNRIKTCIWTKVTCLVGSKLKWNHLNFTAIRHWKIKNEAQTAKHCEIRSHTSCYVSTAKYYCFSKYSTTNTSSVR